MGVHLARGVEKFLRDPKEWFLLVGDRLVLATALTIAFAAIVATLVSFAIVDVRSVTPVLYLFSMLAGGNITLITIVLSINQLVLARQLNTPGEVSDHIENTIEYRTRVEQQADRNAVPVTPCDFLDVLLTAAREDAHRLDSIVAADVDSAMAEEIDSLTTAVIAHTNHIESVLDHSQGGIFSALAVALETNYSKQMNEAHRLKTAHSGDLSSAAETAFDDLIESLQQIDIARQYFKTIFIQDELARLSRILLYVGVPAIGGSILMLLVYTATSPVATLGTALRGLVVVAVVLGFVPLTVLFSFLLRIATVAQRTAAITPFTTPSQEHIAE